MELIDNWIRIRIDFRISTKQSFSLYSTGRLGSTPDKGVPDMTSISDIDEIGINHNLKVRYSRDEIYVSFSKCTYTNKRTPSSWTVTKFQCERNFDSHRNAVTSSKGVNFTKLEVSMSWIHCKPTWNGRLNHLWTKKLRRKSSGNTKRKLNPLQHNEIPLCWLCNH